MTAFVWSVYGLDPRLAYALVNAVAVLIIACPCALGLANAHVDHGGEGPRRADGWEQVDTVVVDKTGTLTEGKSRLVASGLAEAEVLALAAGLEQGGEHPLARRSDAALGGEASRRPRRLTGVGREEDRRG